MRTDARNLLTGRVRPNRYLRAAQRHFLIALFAGVAAFTCIIWAVAAGFHDEPGWCIGAVMAAVFALFVSAIEGSEASRCLEDSEKFER